MLSTEQVQQLIGGTAVDESGDKIGKIGQVYLDDETNRPAWVTVNTGMFGGSESFAPLDGADAEGDSLRLPHSKDKVKDAPRVEADGHITPEEEQTLYTYYGVTGTGSDSRQGTPAGEGERIVNQHGAEGHDTSGPTTDDAMTRSEERLNVGTERHETGRARLRKHVVTREETVTVPVKREEVRVEREPITDANAGPATSGPAISEEEHEVVLHEERPVVQKEAVPVERVRLGTETVTDQEQVSEQVREERIEADTPQGTERR